MESWKELARPHNFEDPGDRRGWYALRTRLDPSADAHVFQEQTRNLVFVGHSYGGLVIKRVRLFSSIRKERGLISRTGVISKSTRADYTRRLYRRARIHHSPILPITQEPSSSWAPLTAAQASAHGEASLLERSNRSDRTRHFSKK